MAKKAEKRMSRSNPAQTKPAGAFRLYNAHTGAAIEAGAVVTRAGVLCRVLLVSPQRSRALLIDLDLEDKENPHDRKEARAEDIGAVWR